MKKLIFIFTILLISLFSFKAVRMITDDPQTSTPDWEVEEPHSLSRFGDGTSIGDLNGDGFNDAVISDPGYGEIYIYNGMQNGPSLIPDKTLYGIISFGNRVDCKGDINNDGFNDLVTGDFRRLYIFYGSSSGVSDSANLIISPPDTGVISYAGYIATADVNGDGFSDVICNIYSHYVSDHQIGAYVYPGSQNGLELIPSWCASLDSGVINTGYGWEVSNAGDVNGDGFEDIIVGSLFSNIAAVYYGSASRGFFQPADKTYINAQVINFGYNVSGGGDFNNDGYDDILIGGNDSVFAYPGSSSGLSDTPFWKNSQCIWIPSAGGDYNNDGFDDMAVSNCFDTATIYFGKPYGLSSEPFNLHCPGAAYKITFGDMNNDSISDVLIGRFVKSYGYYGSSDTVNTLSTITAFVQDQNFTDLCCSTFVNSQYEFPMNNVMVDFEVKGVHPSNFSSLTDTNGVAVYCYPGHDPGYDTIIGKAGNIYDTSIVLWDYPFPVEMQTFTSMISERNVILNWTTSSELNNSGFDIERNLNNTDWIKAGFVNGSGTYSSPVNYSFTDKNLTSGKYNYRLRQIDFNGNF
ncbi:MAG TPA: VCBS repeat-containing protein, partial [Ignavibacteria bacterium]|nr:VCBS repeat-containing protein [Ignavibacteria bacterium]